MIPGRTTAVAALALSVFACGGAALAQAVAPPQDDAATLRERLQPTMSPDNRPMPKDARTLDRWLAAQDDTRLVDRLKKTASAKDIVLDMNWEQSKIFGGAGLTVVLAYVNTLWRVASALPAEDAGDLKDSAAVYTLYALNIITMDGAKCADDSAPTNRFGQVVDQEKPVLDYVRGLSRADRMTIGTIALATEAATSSVRGNDRLICGGGLEQYKHDTSTDPAVRSKPYTAAFIDPDISAQAQTKLRQAMPTQLTQFLAIPEDDAMAPPQAQPPAP